MEDIDVKEWLDRIEYMQQMLDDIADMIDKNKKMVEELKSFEDNSKIWYN